MGAEYCPFCAAERWTMVMWLSRFGTFKNLSEIQSSSTDIYPDTDTFTFHKSSYTSQYIDFSSNEVEDRNQQPLQTLSAATTNIFTKWDTPPYTAKPDSSRSSTSAGSTPSTPRATPQDPREPLVDPDWQ